jgi:hypothetical protein
MNEIYEQMRGEGEREREREGAYSVGPLRKS